MNRIDCPKCYVHLRLEHIIASLVRTWEVRAVVKEDGNNYELLTGWQHNRHPDGFDMRCSNCKAPIYVRFEAIDASCKTCGHKPPRKRTCDNRGKKTYTVACDKWELKEAKQRTRH